MTFIGTAPPRNKPFIAGVLEHPGEDDPQFDTEEEALSWAAEKSNDVLEGRVMAVWRNDADGDGTALWVAWLGDAFKKSS